MYSIQNPSYKDIVTISNSCLIELESTSQRNNNLTEKRGSNPSTVKVQEVYKNEHDKNVNTTGNLIPAEYRIVFWTLLGSQDKWNLVFDRVIARLDELEKQPRAKAVSKQSAIKIEVKELSH
jgi:hypothetical protein